MEQGLQEGCQVKTVTFSHIHQLEIISGGARVAGGMSGKDVTFSHIHQLEIISGGARAARRKSGKDYHIQSQPSAGDHIRWSKGCW